MTSVYWKQHTLSFILLSKLPINRFDCDKPGNNENHSNSGCYKTTNKHIPSLFIKQVCKCWNLIVDCVNQFYISMPIPCHFFQKILILRNQLHYFIITKHLTPLLSSLFSFGLDNCDRLFFRQQRCNMFVVQLKHFQCGQILSFEHYRCTIL